MSLLPVLQVERQLVPAGGWFGRVATAVTFCDPDTPGCIMSAMDSIYGMCHGFPARIVMIDGYDGFDPLSMGGLSLLIRRLQPDHDVLVVSPARRFQELPDGTRLQVRFLGGSTIKRTLGRADEGVFVVHPDRNPLEGAFGVWDFARELPPGINVYVQGADKGFSHLAKTFVLDHAIYPPFVFCPAA